MTNNVNVDAIREKTAHIYEGETAADLQREVLNVLNSEYCATALYASWRLIEERAHTSAREAGWWTDLETGESLAGKRNIPEMLMLIVSEISEAMEAHRRDLMDDKLPHRKGIEAELADAVLRIADFARAHNLDVAGAIIEKDLFNRERADHKVENRKLVNGKKF